MYKETTIAAIATAPGTGGIGVIRVSGPEAVSVVSRVFRAKKITDFKNAEPWRMVYGHIMDGERVVDECLAVTMRAPHSYTGEDVVELQMHGSAEALSETLALLFAAGAEPAERGEFTERAFLNGRIDLTQAEAVMDILNARGKAALTQAESHLSGALSSRVRGLREKLKTLITKLEVTIDYPEEDLEDLTMAEIREALSEIEGPMEALLARADEGRMLREGLSTVICGRPNAGKSSLLNALLEEDRAIVTAVPGTTRDTIEETILVGGVPLRLMDTAGLRHASDEVEKIGIERARTELSRADLVLAVIDASRPLEEEDKKILAEISGRRAAVILNKSDLPQKISEEAIRALCGNTPVISLSAKNGDGMEKLSAALRDFTQTQEAEGGRMLLLTNLRHTRLMQKALEAVRRAATGCEENLPADCIAVDLTEAFSALGEITGETVDDELIHSIFENFCVGK